MKIIIGSDHAGFHFKEMIKTHLENKNHEVVDAGPREAKSCDYPEFGLKVARAVAQGNYDHGVLICGTGIGMSMVANRVKGVRAALCLTEFQARMARAHNDANVLVLGARVLGPDLALSILDVYFETGFEGGRHQRRIDLFNFVD
ncbi:MAG: ribose 5-phosphate isomerase B [Deltaproteobacteria bacterium]|nr:ribose 5-phosphate isomerase B [Deltaproteobacteria bacterium]MBW2087228.1 ribose 5-phosphate isomerase B [Deltaproteobacteria bacterium]